MALNAISSCRSCGSPKIEKFLDLGAQPFANALLKNLGEKEAAYSLSLSYCHDCSLVQLTETADPKELFSDYFWVTGTSSTAREYAERFCRNVLETVDSFAAKDYVLEVASNDGTFLKPFLKRSVPVQGVDSAANIVEMANREGVPTLCAFFGKETAVRVVEEKGRPKAVLVRNVLPHVANLHDFLAGLEYCLDEEGWLVLEIHSAGIIQKELHYDSIYHEHLCYFSLKSVEALLKRYHFEVLKVGGSPISGGSLVVYAKKRGKGDASADRCRQQESESGLNTFAKWKAFAQRAHNHRQKLLGLLDREKNSGKKMVGYGASARSSTLLNFCGIDGRYLSAVADQNALKQGFYTPGTHIPIESPGKIFEKKTDIVLVLAWNFLEEIRHVLKKEYAFEGSLIVPLPGDPRMEAVHGN